MFVPFNQLPPSSLVWIYQGDRQFTPDEESKINGALQSFISGWEVHGAPLTASFEIRYHQFIVLAASETASGCSIDTSVRAIKEIAAFTGMDFFDRNKIAFLENDAVKIVQLRDLKSALSQNVWNEFSYYFNNAVNTLHDYQNRWLEEAGKTWLRRYFFSQSVEK